MHLLRELHKALADNAPDTAAVIGRRILDASANYPQSVIEYVQTLLSRSSAPGPAIGLSVDPMTIQPAASQRLLRDVLEPADVQAAPVPIGDSSVTSRHFIKVDEAIRLESLVLIAGWTTADAEFGLLAAGHELEVRRVSVLRADVAAHFGLDSDAELGIVLVAECPDDMPVFLSWEADGQSGLSRCLQFSRSSGVTSIGARERALFGPALGLLALAYPPFSEQWRFFIKHAASSSTPCGSARGHLEGAVAVEKTKDAVVFGWVVHTPSTLVWLESESGHMYSLDGAYRQFRQDVHDAVGQTFAHGSVEAGFAIHLHGLKPGSKVQLKAISESGVHVLTETQFTTLPIDPVGAARVLFGIGSGSGDLHRRMPLVDAPILAPLIEHHREVLAELPVTGKQLGQAVSQPTVSVIVPLYGRTDFVEHQLIEFAEDPWFRAHVELIYVLDDPSLVEGFISEAASLHKLYRLPLRWLWGSVNRGFSGANNLGASKACGEYLAFLNSDAFPQSVGWLEALVHVLATRPDIGAVGPRLVFADGSIQHAGMEFVRREELGVWVNHHPLMGLDPSLDRHTELAIVPAVTGACLVMRHADFERVGGWDAGYLIGDFEDSDLCLKLGAEGLKSAYLPTIQLTHLERQSFKLLGRDQFSSRVVIYNAVRHQERWGEQIQSVMSEQGRAP